MKKRLARLISVLCLLNSALAFASPDIRFQQVTREQGLSQSFVLSVTQDQTGFMWFGTQSGLNRFDGHEVRVFNRENSGLGDNLIRTLLTDSKGRVWVGTDNGGVALYQPTTESFLVFDSTNSELPIDRMRTLYEDRSGRILVGTDGAGVWYYDEITRRFASYVAFPDPSSQAIWALAESTSGSLLIGTGRGLFEKKSDSAVLRYDHASEGESLKGAHIRTLLTQSDGTVWVGTESLGVLRLDEQGSSQRFLSSEAKSGGQVFDLLEGREGDIWVATSVGLKRILRGEVVTYRNNPAESFSISSDMVLDLHRDNSGVIWLATYGGVNFWAPQIYIAEHWLARAGDDSELSSNSVTSFAETADGSAWIGTLGGGLIRRQLDGSLDYYHPDSSPSFPTNDVMSMFVDSKDQLWVGTRAAGLFLFDPRAGVTRHFSRTSPGPVQLNSNAITDIGESRFGQLLVTTYGGGFSQIQLDDFTVEHIAASAGQSELPSNRIMTVVEDSHGGLWLGTDGAGLVHYDRYRREFNRYGDGRGGFYGDLVLTIREDSAGTLWIGTMTHGLYKLSGGQRDPDEFTFENLSVADGLASDSVYSIEIDDLDGVWLSSNAGITHIDSTTGRPHSLGLRNGLQDLEFNAGASLKFRDGDLLFGGVNGANLISPEAVQYNRQPPPVVVTAISRQGAEVPVSIAADQGVELSHRDYFLEFKFSALDYADSDNHRFRYRLLGLQDEWVISNTRRYVSYNNLLPGEYTFEVQAVNSDGIWSTEPAKVSVKVLPAPWLSSWAYFLYGLCALMLLLAGYRMLINRREHFAETQRINERLTQEIQTRRETEAQILLEREKTQRYIDVAEVMLVDLDAEGTILNANKKAMSLLGNDDDGLIGTKLLEFVNVSQRHNLRQKILAVFDAEDSGEHFECQLQDAGGVIHTVIWRFAPLSESDGHANLILASGTDITELRQLERAVRFKEKFSALGTLSAGIAHDFNNILTAITGYNDLALELVEPHSDTGGFLRKVEQASRRAAELVARILSVTRLDEGQLTTLDLVTSTKDAVKLLRGGLPGTVKLVEHYPDDPLRIEAAQSQIQQLIMNLTSNAINALDGDAGRIDVLIEQKHFKTSELPKGANLASGDFALLHVKDTGPGMPEAMRQKIFDPFYSTIELGEKDRMGAGLGLSIVHGIVLNHKGHIEVESHLGMGTSFTVYFPVSQAEFDDKVVPLPVKRTRSHRIMLVDDEEWIVDVTSRLLSSLGYEVEAFLHPLEALERFKSGSSEFSLVLTDQNMPHMKGAELIMAVRKIRSDIPIVMMSGNVSPLPEDDSIQFMAKPFRLGDLKEVLSAFGLEAATDAGSNKR